MGLLTTEESKRISAAVAAAEANTGGEIVTAIIPESDSYAARELLFGIVMGFVAYFLLILFYDPFSSLVDRLFWGDASLLMPLSMAGVTLFTGSLAYALAQIPMLDRLINGKKNMQEAVHRRALRHFVESAAYDTIDRTGVLLFVSVLERRVELIADKGINDKVDPGAWQSIVNDLTQGIRDKRTADSLERAVTGIGSILAKHVPPRPDDVNELSDGPTELGKGS